jgi:hypothetical protein
MKRTIEIEDCLQDCVDRAIEMVDGELHSHLDQNPDTDKTPDIGNDLDSSGAIHEIIDGSVPIHTAEIDAAFYLYGWEIEKAFEDAGIGSKEDKGWPCGWKAAAIYCYINDKVAEWYGTHADEIFEEWQANQPQEEDT